MTTDEERLAIIARYRENPLVFQAEFVRLMIGFCGVMRQEMVKLQTRLDLRRAGLEADLEKLAAELTGLEERRAELASGENFGVEFDALLENAKIRSLKIKGATIEVITAELEIPFNGYRYWIAPLRMVIDVAARPEKGSMAGDFRPVRVWPSRAKQKISRYGYPNEGPDWPAPHVRGDGSICLGNMSAVVEKAFRKGQWATLINLLIPFLESCSPDHESYAKVLENVAIRKEKLP